MQVRLIPAREIFETTKKEPLYVVIKKEEFVAFIRQVGEDAGLGGNPNGAALNKRIMDLLSEIGRLSA